MATANCSGPLVAVALLVALASSTAAGQKFDQDRGGAELLLSGQRAVIRFPVLHKHTGWHFCYGYLYFSANDIHYDVVYTQRGREKDKEHSFRYPRSELVVAKEYYGSARLEFKGGAAYTFTHLRWFMLPTEDLLQPATQFDSAVVTARRKAAQIDSAPDALPYMADPLLRSSGEVLASERNPVLRFVVAHEGKGGSPMEEELHHLSSCGHLNFSKQSVQYEVVSGAGTDAFKFDRSTLLNAKEYHGWSELEFTGGKHRFTQYGPGQGVENRCLEAVGPYQAILEAANSFPDAVEKAESATRGVVSPSTTVEMARLNQRLAAWRAAGAKVELPEEVVRHRVLAEAAFKEKDFDKAASEYQGALLVYPTWPEGQFNAALVFGELHRYADAVAHMKAYLELTPDAPDAQKAKQQMWIWEDKMK